jgi:hypothetical protein
MPRNIIFVLQLLIYNLINNTALISEFIPSANNELQNIYCIWEVAVVVQCEMLS